MACVGLTPERCIQETDDSMAHHLTVLIEFIMAMRERLQTISENSYNNFGLRVGTSPQIDF